MCTNSSFIFLFLEICRNTAWQSSSLRWDIKSDIYKAKNVSFSAEIWHCYGLTAAICLMELLCSNTPQIKAVHTQTLLINYHSVREQPLNTNTWCYQCIGPRPRSFDQLETTQMSWETGWRNVTILASKRTESIQILFIHGAGLGQSLPYDQEVSRQTTQRPTESQKERKDLRSADS